LQKSSFFVWATRIRSACCASEDLSSWCVGGASLCDYDANSQYRQVNKFPRQYRLFTSDLWSCTTSSLLGLLSASAAVRIQRERIPFNPIKHRRCGSYNRCAVMTLGVRKTKQGLSANRQQPL